MNNNVDLDEYAKWLPIIDSQEMKDAHLPEHFVQRLKRIKGIYDYWLQFPQKTANDILQFEEQQFGIKKTQAYSDIRLVRLLLGENETSTKQFYRWKINIIIEDAIKGAKRAGDFRSIASLVKDYILNNQTDKPDPLELDFEKIVPEKFDMSNDISIVMPGKKKTSRKTINNMLKKYGMTPDMKVEDADYEEMTTDDEK